MTDMLLEQLERSPKLPLYMLKAQQFLEEELKKRERFYETVREDQKAEFINGEVIVHSPAQLRHTTVLGNILQVMKAFVEKNDLGYVGFEKVFICLTRNDYEPDVFFFGKEKAGKFTPDQKKFPAPDLIVEVLSPSTETDDRGVKYEDFAAHNVIEYWIVDPVKETLEQHLLRAGEYELALKSGSGEVRSVALPGFNLPIRAVFDRRENFKALQALLASPEATA